MRENVDYSGALHALPLARRVPASRAAVGHRRDERMAAARRRGAGHAAGDGVARDGDRLVGLAGVRSGAGAHSSGCTGRSGGHDSRLRPVCRARRGRAGDDTREGREHARRRRYASARHGRRAGRPRLCALSPAFRTAIGRARAGDRARRDAHRGTAGRHHHPRRRRRAPDRVARRAAPKVAPRRRSPTRARDTQSRMHRARRIQRRRAAAQRRTVSGHHRQARELDRAGGAGTRRAYRARRQRLRDDAGDEKRRPSRAGQRHRADRRPTTSWAPCCGRWRRSRPCASPDTRDGAPREWLLLNAGTCPA